MPVSLVPDPSGRGPGDTDEGQSADEFMVGESNALAYSACEAIANGDSTLSPCLFIEAGTGLGKSHLTHAVAHHITSHSPGTRLHYVTSQQLTSEMVRSIKNYGDGIASRPS